MDNYDFNHHGVLRQLKYDKIVYDYDYANKYNGYGPLGMQMSYLRLGNLLGHLGHTPRTLLDVGFGNGDFLKVANSAGIKTFGHDISGYDVPEGTTFVNDIYSQYYDVVCFFDVLEHFDNIYELEDLNADYVYITVPLLHLHTDKPFEQWFDNWKHKRPDEHLWHFTKDALTNFMQSINYRLVNDSNIEDLIRKPEDQYANTLTCIFRRNKYTNKSIL